MCSRRSVWQAEGHATHMRTEKGHTAMRGGTRPAVAHWVAFCMHARDVQTGGVIDVRHASGGARCKAVCIAACMDETRRSWQSQSHDDGNRESRRESTHSPSRAGSESSEGLPARVGMLRRTPGARSRNTRR